jgi:SnoaL-like domain
MDAITGLLEREVIISVVNELFLATDRKDWAAVERTFGPHVRFDMSSVGAGEARMSTPREIADGWRTGLAGVERVHHQTGNFVVHIKDAAAEVFCYGVAYHFRRRDDNRNTRVFVGSYDFELTHFDKGWLITAMRFNLKFVDGNPELEA